MPTCLLITAPAMCAPPTCIARFSRTVLGLKAGTAASSPQAGGGGLGPVPTPCAPSVCSYYQRVVAGGSALSNVTGPREQSVPSNLSHEGRKQRGSPPHLPYGLNGSFDVYSKPDHNLWGSRAGKAGRTPFRRQACRSGHMN